MGSISIVGLGPADGGFITNQTWELMKKADVLYFRTKYHPAADDVEKAGIIFNTYDYLYEQSESFEDVYKAISMDVIKRAKTGADIVYAVPGSPMVAEQTVIIIRDMAKQKNIPVRIYAGMSFLELLYIKLNIDPIDGLLVLDALELENQSVYNSVNKIITQLYDVHTASEVKLTLMGELPDDHEVALIYHLGLADEKIDYIPLYELDRHKEIDYLTSLYVPRYDGKQTAFTIQPLSDIIHILRAPGGCPWDIVQTHKSLRRNLIEEVYEVIEAIDLQDADLLCEELGDLLMQIVFHARVAEETGVFSMQDVVDGVTKKLIHRHPHVFGNTSVKDAGEVLLNWEKIKREEKKDRKSVLDGVPKDLPALMSAYKLQYKAAKVGFDWKTVGPVWEKVTEEFAELKNAVAANDEDNIEEELGDLLFSVVNLSRFLKVDAELALRSSNKKFCRRFSYIEKELKRQNKDWDQFNLAQLDRMWDAAKAAEK
ncbi:bifunctional methyltransferase/pyrophosphohydrolase YabN [Pectinatus sottacetonis]|uniref:nucleoside triphosphate pyrophosphohydrolase n=1 Tax=Pectinatus sottacetonis TaxID=1002795 RepID=UPI0018C6C7E9|nr:nucleoside triphosphate pyrophosphohydrolase [Pectinatus sottacetonis]